MKEHKLSTGSRWARSHAGKNYWAKCSCGEWGYGTGGGLLNYNAILIDEFEAHVRKAIEK